MLERLLYNGPKPNMGLGWRPPTDRSHEKTYAWSAAVTGVPVVLGVNWYTNFDAPQKDADGHWWIGRGDLGTIRGGHCICAKPGHINDPVSWWLFYNQGSEGACVGFGVSRAVSLLKRGVFNAWWLWDEAKLTDPWPDTNPGDENGTSVNAGLQIVATRGHVRWERWMRGLSVDARDQLPAYADYKISGYRWASNAQDAIVALGSPLATQLGALPLINSWGRAYPRVTWLPGETLDRLLSEGGEAGVVIP